jgi:uncharacterized protein (TIGR00730 family)
MNDPFGVRRIDGGGDRREDIANFGWVEHAPLLKNVPQRRPIEKLHDEIGVATLVDPEVVNRYGVRMVEPSRGASFPTEALERCRISYECRVHELQRDTPANLEMDRLEDRAHTPFAELSLDPVLPVDDTSYMSASIGRDDEWGRVDRAKGRRVFVGLLTDGTVLHKFTFNTHVYGYNGLAHPGAPRSALHGIPRRQSMSDNGDPLDDYQKHTQVLAFENTRFLRSPDARILRILAEYLEPASRLRREGIRDTVVFFGSARILPPTEAAAALELVRAEVSDIAEPTPEDLARVARAEKFVRLGDYYRDATELARLVTKWSKGLTGERHFVVCTGGGGGIMQAVNHGAALAGGRSLGLNITLPFEQGANEFITRRLIFDFHYFFMRKFWFVYLAKALVVFPGGFGTFDEMFEVLTLFQTKKPRKTMPIVLYGSEYWNDVVNFEKLAEWGTISPRDVDLFKVCDTPQDAFTYIRTRLEELYLGGAASLEDVKVT